ncbi:MAG: phosphatase PAP2 family protein [Gemmatimonadota bacterium]|jgi:undecaprenyl-diphosphatase
MTTLILRLRQHDERALAALVAYRRPFLDGVMRAVTHMGSAAFTIGTALLLLLGPVPGSQTVGAHAAFALAASFLAAQVLKRTVVRPRPRMPVGMESLTRAPDRFSFPSGHSAAALSIALPIAHTLPGLGLAVLAVGLIVGFSRCYLGVHYPGDVLAGWALAACGVLLAGPALALF